MKTIAQIANEALNGLVAKEASSHQWMGWYRL
jgi:hypothetical protein